MSSIIAKSISSPPQKVPFRRWEIGANTGLPCLTASDSEASRCRPGGAPGGKFFPDRGFTLIELLVVVGIMVTLMALIVPAITGIKGGRDVASAAYAIAGLLDQSRAYAMANNTHVFVGFAEVDDSYGSSVTPQKTTTASPYGRVAVAVVASKDGTGGYGSNPAVWSAATNDANLFAIGKLQYFDNLHMAATAAGTTGGMAGRPLASATVQVLQVGGAAFTSYTEFYWPLAASSKTSAQYDFTRVLEFDPQGVAWFQSSSNINTMVQYFEIGLLPTHGNTVPSSPPADVAAIQIDGMTGATRIYRP
jgi:prepilin-type N-terminal cleavage/methylation domain-containing protein